MLLTIVIIASQIYYILTGLVIGKTCFPKVGCFKNGSPWTTHGRPALPPQRPGNTHPFFYFHNRQFPQGLAYEIFPKRNFTNFSLHSHKTSYVIIHGWTDASNRTWIIELTDLLLKKDDVNVFVLDFSNGGGGNYLQAVGNIRLFGRIYAKAFVKTKIPSSKFHMIGHSLGAHLGSYIAKEMKEMGHLVGWLTGLDPALPLYENAPKEVRIDSNDAEFVDIHHTDSGIRGMLRPIGHVDFYYNSGTLQPCELKMSDIFGCGHQIVHTFYISSIRYECIYGIPSTLKSGMRLMVLSILRGSITTLNETACTPSTCLPVGIKTKYYHQKGIFTALLEKDPPYCSINK